MSETIIVHLTSELLWMVLLLSLPVVIVASIVGVIVSLVQALTQIQDQTLQFLIKLVAVCITLVVSYHWMGGSLLNYANMAFDQISHMGARMISQLPAELTTQLPVLALCMMRPLGMMLLLPLFKGGAMGSALIRNSLILLFALPTVSIMDGMQSIILQADMWSVFSLFGKEILVGFLLGFCAAIPFWAIDMAGFVIDTMRGASMSTVLNPLMGLQSSIYGMLFTQLLTVLFLVSGGFNHLLAAMYQSYNQLPPGFDLNFTQPLLVFISHEWQLMCQLCLSFAMPAMVIMILVDVALGLVNRSAQQLNVFFLSMPIKSALVLLLLIYSLQFALSHYLERISGIEQQISILFGLLSSH